MLIANYNFPDNKKYWVGLEKEISPLWMELESTNSKEVTEMVSKSWFLLGVTEFFAQRIDPIVQIHVRNEKLKLRKLKPFAEIFTQSGGQFSLLSPVKGEFVINKNIFLNPNIIKNDPYLQWIIKVLPENDDTNFSEFIYPNESLEKMIQDQITKKRFLQCELCPDLSDSRIVRRRKLN